MKVFTAWEITLYLKYLQQYGFLDADKCSIVLAAYQLKSDATVNMIRKCLGAPNDHPDPVRGNMYVWEDEIPDLDNDYLIPYNIAQYVMYKYGITIDPADMKPAP